MSESGYGIQAYDVDDTIEDSLEDDAVDNSDQLLSLQNLSADDSQSGYTVIIEDPSDFLLDSAPLPDDLAPSASKSDTLCSPPSQPSGGNSILEESLAEPDPPQQRQTQSPYYWNDQYQRIVSMPDSLDKYQKLARLSRDFLFTAKKYGKIIISERYVPLHQKTISPCDAGGLAGGLKYTCCSIFFKFAIDVSISPPGAPPRFLYGGDDAAAMKAAANDFLGLAAYQGIEIPQLRLPLMTVIDYRGFRLSAQSILPISPATLVYGSSDAGLHVHADDPALNALMQAAAAALNLKGHLVGNAQHGLRTLHAPGDLEGHLGTDGAYYVLDFGRVFPPERPPRENPLAVFSCLLRPEFVADHAAPLSSDAFSGFGQHDKKTHNREVVLATRALHARVIPDFAQRLHRDYPADSPALADPSGLPLCALVHQSGINLRHCGRIRAQVPEENGRLRALLLSEMVARTLKVLLRQRLRTEMAKRVVPGQEPYFAVVVRFFNAYVLENEEHASFFWFDELKAFLTAKFPSALSPAELSKAYNLREAVDFPWLLHRACALMAVKFSPGAVAEILRNEGNVVLYNFDLIKLSVKVRHLSLIDEADAQACLAQALALPPARTMRLWDIANRKFELAFRSNTRRPPLLYRWGNFFLQHALRTEENFLLAQRSLTDSASKLLQAIELSKEAGLIAAHAYLDWGIGGIESMSLSLATRTGFSLASYFTQLNLTRMRFQRALALLESGGHPEPYKHLVDKLEQYASFSKVRSITVLSTPSRRPYHLHSSFLSYLLIFHLHPNQAMCDFVSRILRKSAQLGIELIAQCPSFFPNSVESSDQKPYFFLMAFFIRSSAILIQAELCRRRRLSSSSSPASSSKSKLALMPCFLRNLSPAASRDAVLGIVSDLDVGFMTHTFYRTPFVMPLNQWMTFTYFPCDACVLCSIAIKLYSPTAQCNQLRIYAAHDPFDFTEDTDRVLQFSLSTPTFGGGMSFREDKRISFAKNPTVFHMTTIDLSEQLGAIDIIQSSDLPNLSFRYLALILDGVESSADSPPLCYTLTFQGAHCDYIDSSMLSSTSVSSLTSLSSISSPSSSSSSIVSSSSSTIVSSSPSPSSSSSSSSPSPHPSSTPSAPSPTSSISLPQSSSPPLASSGVLTPTSRESSLSVHTASDNNWSLDSLGIHWEVVPGDDSFEHQMLALPSPETIQAKWPLDLSDVRASKEDDSVYSQSSLSSRLAWRVKSESLTKMSRSASILSPDCLLPGSSHLLSLHSFHLGTACHHCRRPLRGIARQGYICLQCKIPCHRACAPDLLSSSFCPAASLPPQYGPSYYEITLSDLQKNALVAIGLANSGFPPTGTLPGHRVGSWALHSRDGRVYLGSKRRYTLLSTTSDTTFGARDTIGCGVNQKGMFWTKNGNLLGTLTFEQLSYPEVLGPGFDDTIYPPRLNDRSLLYPTLGCDYGMVAISNFGGPEKSFRYQHSAPEHSPRGQRLFSRSAVISHSTSSLDTLNLIANSELGHTVLISREISQMIEKFGLSTTFVLFGMLCPYSSSLIPGVTEFFRNLRALDLSHLPYPFGSDYVLANSFLPFFATAHASKSFVSVDISHSRHVTNNTVLQLISILPPFLKNSLRFFHLSSTDVDRAGILAIAEAFPHIERLSFDTNLPQPELATLLHFSSLSFLDFSQYGPLLTDPEVEPLLRHFTQTLRYLDISGCTKLTFRGVFGSHRFPQLACLLINNYSSPMKRMHLSSLIKMLNRCPKLSLLSASCSSFVDERFFTEFFPIHIKHLNLQRDTPEPSLTKALIKFLSKANALHSLNLSHQSLDPVQLNQFFLSTSSTRLHTLDLSHSLIDDDALNQLLSKAPGILRLSLRACLAVSRHGLSLLASCASLRILDISYILGLSGDFILEIIPSSLQTLAIVSCLDSNDINRLTLRLSDTPLKIITSEDDLKSLFNFNDFAMEIFCTKE